MEQHQLIVCALILFAFFLHNKVVVADYNDQNSSREELLMATSTAPIPGSNADDMQQMLDYLSKTVPRDDTGSDKSPATSSDSLPNTSNIHSTAPVPGSNADDMQQMLDYLSKTVPRDDTGSDESPANSTDSLHNTSYIHSGKDFDGSYIRAGFSFASAIIVGHFFL